MFNPKETNSRQETLTPIFTCFEEIFRSVGEEPLKSTTNLHLNLGWAAQHGVETYYPGLRASFEGAIVDVSASTPISIEERDRIIALAEEQAASVEQQYNELDLSSSGKVIVSTGSGVSADPGSDLLFDRQTAINAFAHNFSPLNRHVVYHIATKKPPRLVGNCESLQIAFPDSSLIRRRSILVPQVDYRPPPKGFLTMGVLEFSQKISALAQAAQEQLQPLWEHWHEQQAGELQGDPILKVLEERYQRAFETLHEAAFVHPPFP
jgi:hypothetical protein